MYDYFKYKRFRARKYFAKGLGKFLTATKGYWTIFPTESEYARQSFWKGINPWYANWLESRSRDVQNRNTRQYYNLGWDDITYPHLSGVSGGNTMRNLGSGAWQFSQNMKRLYR